MLLRRKEPKADGVLVFDKVKVISRMMWNSRSQTMIGLAMSYEEMSSLMDVYQSISSENDYLHCPVSLKGSNIFDIVGPYFIKDPTLAVTVPRNLITI